MKRRKSRRLPLSPEKAARQQENIAGMKKLLHRMDKLLGKLKTQARQRHK